MVKFINIVGDGKHIDLKEPGDYVAFMHNKSGSFVFNLESPKINLDIYGLYVGKKNDDFRVETIQNHKSPNSTSNLFIKGVFDDASKFHYQGLIRIEKKAQKSHAYQKNQNLILSPGTYVESEPYLEILANDVFCTHGSTTGRLNDEELFYLKSRGLDQKRAEKLLVSGFIRDIVDRIQEKVRTFKFDIQ